ncbi:hypothetical protein BA904_16460 [Klebsiella pneumoniae]|nr:hypothetical protein BA904_16460 [Klebsiella pneumoniae]
MITTDDGLRAVCEAASAASAVALDTEFVRTRTYYPQLGLLQLFDGQQVSLIDPLTINDWAPMRDLLLNQDVTKYLHAGSEDLEVFLNAFNLMPQPLIDTQILAAFCGRPMSWGFASMVEEYSDVQARVLIDQALAQPLDPQRLAEGIIDPQEALEIYYVSCAVIDIDHFMERSYLNALGDALALPKDVRADIEQDIQSQKQALSV